VLQNTTKQEFVGKLGLTRRYRRIDTFYRQPHQHLLCIVYIVVHDNASAQANRVIGQPYALEDGASIRLLSRLLITRAPAAPVVRCASHITRRLAPVPRILPPRTSHLALYPRPVITTTKINRRVRMDRQSSIYFATGCVLSLHPVLESTRSESFRERMFHSWNFRSRERMVLGAKSPYTRTPTSSCTV